MKKPTLWKYKSGKKKGKLRPQARAYLSFKLKEHHRKRKPSVVRTPVTTIRHMAVKLWTLIDEEHYFPQLEIKGVLHGHRFNRKQAERILNKNIKRIKEEYDFRNSFKFENVRRRIAYEHEEVDLREKTRDGVHVTVWEDEGVERTTKWYKLELR